MMKTQFYFSRVLVVACAFGAVLPRAAAVTDEEFNALKELVTKQGQRIDQLERTNEWSGRVHAEDRVEISRLQMQLAEAQMAATNSARNFPPDGTAATFAPPPIPPVTHHFSLVGDAEIQFGKTSGQHAGFELADFAPIFLYRTGEKVLFEAGFDASLQNNAPNAAESSTAIDLSFAQMDYLFSDYMTFVGGYMILPLGTYVERGAGWLNKIPDDPLARDVLPSTGAGAQLRGAFAVGQTGQMLTYSVFGVNGPSSADGTDRASALDLGGNVGINPDGSAGNLHGSPSGGGRIGWFYPWKAHYDLELGLSGQTGTWDNAEKRRWSAAVIDAALHVSSNFELKGEYINTWAGTGDSGTIRPRGWWLQTGYKLAGLNLDVPFLNNLEFVGQYDTVKDGLGTTVNRFTAGYVYYFSNTLLFEGDYEFINSNDPAQNHDRFVLQLSYGF